MPLSNFLPSTAKIPNSVGLSLSGGGFRATLFHLGAIRRLNEFGILPKLTTVSSVSGGSILNGFLASRLETPLSNGITDFDNSTSKKIRQFCSLDIRRLAMSAWKLRNLVQAGEIACIISDGTGSWLFDLRYLDNWIERQKRRL